LIIPTINNHPNKTKTKSQSGLSQMNYSQDNSLN